jgi:hypothetical protein
MPGSAKPGDYLYLTTGVGDVLMVQYLGLGGRKRFTDGGERFPWVEACQAVGMYVVGSQIRTEWDRLSKRRPPHKKNK